MNELKIAENQRRNAGKYVLIIYTSTSCGACNSLKKNGVSGELKKTIIENLKDNGLSKEEKKKTIIEELKKITGINGLKKIILTETLANFIHYEPKRKNNALNKKLSLPNYIPCFKLYLTQDIIDISKKNVITSIDLAHIKNGRLFAKINGEEEPFNYMDFDFIAKVVNDKIAPKGNNSVETTRKGGGTPMQNLRRDPRNKKNLLIPTASSSKQYYSGNLFYIDDSDSDEDDFY